MYGLNNNTGLPYSQQDNPAQMAKKGINSSKENSALKQIEKLTGFTDSLSKTRSDNSMQRIQGMAEMAAMFM